jgi:hypothetical protein
VDHIHNFNDVGVLSHPVHDDEGQRRERQFACTIHATDSSAFGKISEPAKAVIYRSPDALRGCWIVEPNVVDYVLEVGRRVRGPTNLHLLLEHFLKTSPDFLVSEKLAAVKPVHACSYLLPKPGIVVQIAFDELLDVVIRAAAVFGGDSVEPCLQLWFEVNFHFF